MKLTKTSQFALIGFLFTLTILLRYPKISHHYGFDAYFIHGMANSISLNKFAAWIVHPASVYGFYPLSYPTGIPYVLAAISKCTGLSIEGSILLLSILFGLLGSYGTFMMVGEINDSFLIKFFSAFTFSLAPVLLRFTYWTMSTRAPFVVFLPILLFFLLRILIKRYKIKYVILAIILLFSMPAMHHFALLLPIILVAFFVTVLISHLISYAKKKLIKEKEISTVISPILLTLFGVLFFLEINEFSNYSPKLDLFKNYFIHGNEAYVIFLNLCIFYGLHYGAIIVFSAIGFSLLILKNNRNPSELFIIILLLFFISFLIDNTYLAFFVMPLIIPFIAYGLYEVFKNIESRKFVSMAIFITILLLSTTFTHLAQSRHLEERFHKDSGLKRWMVDETYNTALYLKSIEKDGASITNDYQLHRRMWAISGVPIMPFDNVEHFLFDGSIDEKLKIERLSITEVYLEHYDVIWQVDWEKTNFTKKEPYWVINYNCNEVKSNLSKYNLNYAVENNHLKGKYGNSLRYFDLSDSGFFKSIPDKKFKIYDNGFEVIWYLYP